MKKVFDYVIIPVYVYDFPQSCKTDAVMWLNCYALHIDSVVAVHLAQLCFEHRLNLLISGWLKRQLEPFGVSCCYESKSLAVLKGHEPQSIFGHSQLLRVIPGGE